MTPTLVTNSEGDVILAVGGAGGPRIITGTLQALLGVVDRGASAAEAVGAPRIHHQWLPQEVFVEASFPEDGRAGLTDEGFSVATLERGAIVQAATWDPTTGTWDGAADPRGGGAAVVVPAP
jgi:gamma-glutamyltranspeptidase/glutathione hydrolase